ncbi:MAG: PilZ domain-containing protein [Thermoanaerobaculia bacterium]|nr:PilZ domain-containing protein [Thermoanaerobaculia bacterium]
MSDDLTNQSDLRIETGSRARELPENAHIKKRFDKFQDFVDLYRSRISLGGAFVDTELLRPVGSEVYLDFRLQDGYRLLYGLAEVVWVRLKTMTGERPKGMGLRFLSLDESGRELVLKLLEEQVKSGGAPFEVDRVPEDGSIDPTVVQALAGPSEEEHAAAQQAKTGSRPAQQPIATDLDDSESLPDLPPGVLPPPEDEADFSAPWGEQLPEIPDELLTEPKATGGGGPSVPAVEAPESPYAPGSGPHDETHDETESADLALEPPVDDGDPHLDETDFGASAWDTEEEDPAPEIKPVGGVTTLQEAQGSIPFTDFDGDSVPEVDGTLFQLPDSQPAAAAAEEPSEASVPAEPSQTSGTDTAAPARVPELGPEEPTFVGSASSAGAFDVEFGEDSDSQVIPPADVGDGAGSAWADSAGEAELAPDFERTEPEPVASFEATETEDATAQPAEIEEASVSAAPDVGFAFEPPPETEGGSASATPDVGFAFEPPAETDTGSASATPDVGFAFEPPAETESVAQEGGEAGFSFETPLAPVADLPDVSTPESIAASALAGQLDEQLQGAEEPQPSAPVAASERSTDTADDLFAFRGPPDAQPALDPEETASLRGGALPDLSDTVMGAKAPTTEGEDLQHSYDDWEEWAPHPTGSGSRTKMLIGVVVLLAVVGGASFFFRSTLLPMIGFGGGTATSTDPPPTLDNATSSDEEVETYSPPDDPLAEPVEVAEPDPGNGIDPEAAVGTDSESETSSDSSDGGAVTQASAESLRPSSTGGDSPPSGTVDPPPAETQSRAPPTTRETGGSRSAAGTARRVESIDVVPGSGSTDVIVHLNGEIRSGQYTHDQLSWAPDREMVTLLGFDNFEQTVIAGRGSHLQQIRVGFHPGKELRLVFDLRSDSVSIQGVQAQGSQLVVRLSD